MVNQKLHIGLIALALTSILVSAVALPAANALTPRDFQYLHDNHQTDRWSPGGSSYVCGDKVCTPDEWAKMKQDIGKAQRDSTVCPQLKSWMPCGITSTTKSG